jgi:hypothetical protein
MRFTPKNRDTSMTTKDDKHWSYFEKYYGPKGLYKESLVDITYTKQEFLCARDIAAEIYGFRGFESIGREVVRDVLLAYNNKPLIGTFMPDGPTQQEQEKAVLIVKAMHEKLN